MTFRYLNVDQRTPDYFLSEAEVKDTRSVDVDLSDEFLKRYEEVVNEYDGIQAELELMFTSRLV
jgi:hypothetical protein